MKNHIPTTNHRLMWELSAAILSFVLMIIASITTGLAISPWFWGLAFIVGGFFKAVEGVTKTIEEKALNVEFLMIAAALAAFTTGDFPEGAVLIFIFAVSGVLEQFATSQTEKALISLLKVAPKTAILLQNNIELIVSITQLKINNIVVVKPGQQVPADGVVHLGGASLDQSSITGEFNPVEKLVGDSVFAGSICIDSTMQIRVTKDPSQSVFQKMIDLVKRAQEEKTKSEKRISLFEKIYVYFVLLLSLFIIFATPWFGWLSSDEGFRRGVIVLVVASPCALVASITPALLSTLSHAAKKGILIKSGRYIEMLRHIDVVAFDKTGTLTTGKPKVIGSYFATSLDEKRYLPILVNAERSSNHPLAKAISKHFSQIPAIPLVIKELPGRGLEVNHQGLMIQIGKFPMDIPTIIQQTYAQLIKEGKSTVNIVINQQMIGFIALQDTEREEAKVAIDQLKQLNVEPVMLTGDKQETALAIAQKMGITNVHADCLPEGKVTVVKDYIAKQKRILMIGDGINDAPALATATIGVSMGDGTDVSLETADIVMMNNQLQNIPYLIRLAKRTQTIIYQNVIFSISVIFILLISNLLGVVILRYGVLSHELSTILVILNSLRLLSSKKKMVRI